VANVRTHIRETNRSNKAKETYVEAAEEFLLNLAGQEKYLLSMQLTLQIFLRT
jgi:histone H3/H4